MVDTKQLRHVVNIASTDITGDKALFNALRSIKGVGFMYANAVIYVSGYDRTLKIGYLEKDDVFKIEEIMRNPLKHNIPVWLVNRKHDYETGEDVHIIGSNLGYYTENDIKRLKKIRAYRGTRHAAGLPTRGQSTKSNSRRTKSANSKRKKK